MSEYDIHSVLGEQKALTIGTISTNTDTDGDWIDTAGFEAIEFIVLTGTLTDGSYELQIQQSSATSGQPVTNVTGDLLLGGSKTLSANDDNKAVRIGSIGKERYQRLRIVSTGVTTGGNFGAIAMQGKPKFAPVAEVAIGA